MNRLLRVWVFAGLLLAAPASFVHAQPETPADLIVHNGKVLTVDAKFSTAEAVAVSGGKIVAVGKSADVLKLKGPKTRVIDASGKTVMPGLYDSHTHPVGAAGSEVGDPIPLLRSIPEVLDYIKKRASELPEGKWIVIQYAFPTRLKKPASRRKRNSTRSPQNTRCCTTRVRRASRTARRSKSPA